MTAAAVATRGLESRFYRVSRYDPLTIAAACGALLAVAVIASVDLACAPAARIRSALRARISDRTTHAGRKRKA